MTERDFYLLVREYFNLKNSKALEREARLKSLEVLIQSALADFTKRELESLPFKD